MTRAGGGYSGSAGESGHTSMGDGDSPSPARRLRRGREPGEYVEGGGGGMEAEEEGSNELWAAFSKGFGEVQTVLDQNRILIQQVNDNHQSRLPDNLTKNVSLIREINGNISKVVSLYSGLSSDFCHVFQHRRLAQGGSNRSASTGGDHNNRS